MVAGIDTIFEDADRHGPRWPVLARRLVPAVAAVPTVLAVSCATWWRELVIGAVDPASADVLLVLPVLVVIVWLGAAAAPLARIRTQPLLGVALMLLGCAAWLVRDGTIVLAAVPAAWGAMLLGIAAARAIRRAVWALPLLLAAGLSDAHSVDGGVTHDLLAETSIGAGREVFVVPSLHVLPELVNTVDYLVLHLPAATGTWLLGLVDVIAIGLLLGLTHLYWLPMGRTALALGAGLALTLGAGVPVPVLPMLGIAWVVVHGRLVWRSTRFSMRRLTYLGG